MVVKHCSNIDGGAGYIGDTDFVHEVVEIKRSTPGPDVNTYVVKDSSI